MTKLSSYEKTVSNSVFVLICKRVVYEHGPGDHYGDICEACCLFE